MYHERLSYDANTGIFTWKSAFGSRSKVGEAAGGKTKDGYITISFNRKSHLAHRLAWAEHYGPLPEGYEIDHINGVRDDNRLINLRMVTRSQNNENHRSARKDSKTGVIGVTLFKPRGLYLARIKVDGKTLYLGYYKTTALASAAYVEAKRKYHSANTL